MKVRNLLTAISVLAAFSFTSWILLAEPGTTTSPVVFVRGLLMLQLEQRDGLHIILPDAPGHKATITLMTKDGKRISLPMKGRSTIQTSEPDHSPAVVKVPELVRLKELFGTAFTPQVDRAPANVSIPWSSIRSVTTDEVSPSRYTFIRTDNGEELETFRPRNIAETIRIQLTSVGQLDFKPLKSDIDVEKVKEIWIEQVPKSLDSADMFRDHFHHYLHYIERAAGQNFNVEPRKLWGASTSTARFGQSFWIGGDLLCGPVAVD
jgi:hypothetical protein